jgi:hypothetical protein
VAVPSNRIVVLATLFSLGCAMVEHGYSDRWDYADVEAGIYFNLPPGWSFLPPHSVEAVVGGLANGLPTRSHFGAVREATREYNYPDGFVVFSGPTHHPSGPRLTLSQACARLFANAPYVEDGSRRLFAENHQYCAIPPDPIRGLEGTLYLVVGKAGVIFVAAFAPTFPAETRIGDALRRLYFAP